MLVAEVRAVRLVTVLLGHSLPPLKKKTVVGWNKLLEGDGERGLVKGRGLKWVCWRREL